MTTVLFVFAIFAAVWMGILVTGKIIVRDGKGLGINIFLFSVALTAVITKVLGIWQHQTKPKGMIFYEKL